ncbi:MAG: GNAT family N-acetyltransferase [Nodosilinea sp.]
MAMLAIAPMVNFSLPGYHIQTGSPLDRSRLVRVMECNHQELTANGSSLSMAATVDRYLSSQTPLWWIWPAASQEQPGVESSEVVACLWLGQAIDQYNGLPHPYVLLLYVSPHHRRRGLATALLQVAHSWAKDQGYSQISLQVWTNNQPAQALYRKLGYQPQAILMKSYLEVV